MAHLLVSSRASIRTPPPRRLLETGPAGVLAHRMSTRAEFTQEQRDYVRYRHKPRTDNGKCRVDHDDWPCQTMQLLEAYEELARVAQVRLDRLLQLIPMGSTSANAPTISTRPDSSAPGSHSEHDGQGQIATAGDQTSSHSVVDTDAARVSDENHDDRIAHALRKHPHTVICLSRVSFDCNCWRSVLEESVSDA